MKPYGLPRLKSMDHPDIADIRPLREQVYDNNTACGRKGTKMTNKERNLVKKKILKCLTEDFEGNQAIFDKKEGWQVFSRKVSGERRGFLRLPITCNYGELIFIL